MLLLVQINAFAQAERRYVSFSDTSGLLQTLNEVKNLALLQPDSALSQLLFLYGESKRIRYSKGQILSALEIGDIYQKTGRYPEAGQLFHQAILQSQKSNTNQEYLALIYNNLGNNYNYLGDFEQAVQAYFRSISYLKRYPENTSVKVSYLYNNLSTVLLELNDLERAFVYFALKNLYPDLAYAEAFQTASHLLNETSKDIRKVAHNLLPGELANQSLTRAIETFCARLFANTDISYEFNAYGRFEQLSPAIALNIYRIMQELLHNIIKHAQATEVIILLNEHESEITLTVQDNGSGIPKRKTNGVGLSNVQNRVKVLAGMFSFSSDDISGTVMNISLPYGKKLP